MFTLQTAMLYRSVNLTWTR